MAAGQISTRRQAKERLAKVRRKGLCIHFCGNKREDGFASCRKCRKKASKKRKEE